MGMGPGVSIADKGWKSSRGRQRTAHQGAVLGDVGTVADLFATVLRRIAEQRGLETWEQLAAYAAEEWFRRASPSGNTRAVPSRSDALPVAGAFKPRMLRATGYVAERRFA